MFFVIRFLIPIIIILLGIGYTGYTVHVYLVYQDYEIQQSFEGQIESAASRRDMNEALRVNFEYIQHKKKILNYHPIIIQKIYNMRY